MTEPTTAQGGKLRVNLGDMDWHVGMTMEEFENLYFHADGEFITLPLMFDNQPHANIKVRPSQIKYYLEEVPKPL